MLVKYLGHSAFYLKGKEFSVVTDPFSDIGYGVERVDCDYALSSHAHFDHNYFDGVNARKNVTECYGPFTSIPCWHDEVCGGKRGANNAFFFELMTDIERNRPGWANYTQADYIFYGDSKGRKFYVFQAEAMREYLR